MPVELFIWPLEKPCRTNWLGSWIALVSLVVSELCALLEPQNGRKFALRSVKHTYLSLSLFLSRFINEVQFNSMSFSLLCAFPFQKMTRWALWTSCWAARIVVRSASCPSSWHNCDRNWPCPYSPVSADTSLSSLSVMSFYYYIYYIYHHISLVCRNYASLSERTWGCARPAAAVPAALVAEYGAGRNECAARHAPIVYYGKWRRLMRGVKRGFSWYFHSLFNTALSETFCPSWKVKKAS